MHQISQKLLTALTLFALSTFGLLSSTAHAQDKLHVTATFSILGDLVRFVGGERLVVSTLVGADQDAHMFEPRPADAKTILKSQLLVTNGLGFEPWAVKLAQSAGYKGEILVASKGVKARHMAADKAHGSHAHEPLDPHAWQNPLNVIFYVRNIAAALGKLDASGAAVYTSNAEAYVKELQVLDAWTQQQLAVIAPSKRKVITSHDAFGYFAAQYQVKFLAPQGINTDTEPSAKQVAQLIRQIQREKIRAVFVENMSNPQLLTQLSKDTGVKVGASLYSDALSGTNQPADTYLHMMKHNVTHLVAGMNLN